MDKSGYPAPPLQLDKICRVCLTKKCNMKCIYDASLDNIFNFFTSIKAQHDDGLPTLMCVQCVRQCSRAYSFKQQCDKSDSILREFIKPEIQLQAELQDSVMPATLKIEVDDSCEVDQYAEMAHDPIKDEIECDPLAFTDSDPKADPNTIKQADNDKPLQLFDPLEEPSAAKAPPVHKKVRHICTVCRKSFGDAYDLKRHTYIHFDKKPYQCDQCNMNFNERCDLIMHKEKHTDKLNNIVSKLYSCSLCDKAFTWNANLKKHMKYHTGNDLLNCSYCNKKFVEEGKLKLHVRSHTGERPYVCDVCKKTFSLVCALRNHALVHTGEKPFVCSVCGKGFTQSGSLGIHMRSHAGAKPYVCSTCGKAYTSLYTLKYHQRVHTEETHCKI